MTDAKNIANSFQANTFIGIMSGSLSSEEKTLHTVCGVCRWFESDLLSLACKEFLPDAIVQRFFEAISSEWFCKNYAGKGLYYQEDLRLKLVGAELNNPDKIVLEIIETYVAFLVERANAYGFKDSDQFELYATEAMHLYLFKERNRADIIDSFFGSVVWPQLMEPTKNFKFSRRLVKAVSDHFRTGALDNTQKLPYLIWKRLLPPWDGLEERQEIFESALANKTLSPLLKAISALEVAKLVTNHLKSMDDQSAPDYFTIAINFASQAQDNYLLGLIHRFRMRCMLTRDMTSNFFDTYELSKDYFLKHFGEGDDSLYSIAECERLRCHALLRRGYNTETLDLVSAICSENIEALIRVGHIALAASFRVVSATVMLKRGRFEDAREELSTALSVFSGIDDISDTARAKLLLCEIDLQLTQQDGNCQRIEDSAVRSGLAETRELYREIGSNLGELNVRLREAWCETLCGSNVDAISQLRRLLEDYDGIGDLAGMRNAQVLLVGSLVKAGASKKEIAFETSIAKKLFRQSGLLNDFQSILSQTTNYQT